MLACSHYAKIKTLDKWLVLIELMRSIAKTWLSPFLFKLWERFSSPNKVIYFIFIVRNEEKSSRDEEYGFNRKFMLFKSSVRVSA